MNLLTLLHHFAAIIALFTLIIGIFAAAKPKAMAKNFGVPVPPEAYPFVIATGLRDIYIGLGIFVLYFLNLWFAIAITCLCLGLLALGDFVIVRKYGVKKVSWAHFLGATGAFIYGSFLLVYSSAY